MSTKVNSWPFTIVVEQIAWQATVIWFILCSTAIF